MGYKKYLRATEAFHEAVPLAHAFEDKLPILEELTKAHDELGEELKGIEQATSEKEKASLMRARRIADCDPMGRSVGARPTKHEQQLEGLFLFAERMQWPYLDDVRACAVKACRDWLALREPIFPVQMDWLFAVMLPGKHFAHVLMAMLILSTPAIEKIGMAPNSECGFALPECSYWRSRSVLGRVLGCLPGVTSLNGWVGFSQPGTGKHISFTLEHNPIFIILPACSLSAEGRIHKIHRRQLDQYRFQKVSMGEISEVTPQSVEEILVIKATAPGSEVVARALCAQVGRAAVVRTAGGPCFGCAAKGAGRLGLEVGVIIWVA